MREDGRVEDVSVLRSSGSQDLDIAAVKAVKGWKYRPLQPKERFVTIQPIIFTLEQ